ncbi:ABC transporter permease [Sphingosinithalassobacter sp. CS137]|uniref:ABC transporter permease n=1 Tax=Sphingosinithalassobacter sp. CS137 TaxID=2762748 RepID=UPI00165D7305|nr:ABC transporter permease [Sphingosinithalassobacter sp. CS137]
MMLHRYLIVEILKLRRSLALLLCLAAPSCVAILNLLIGLDSEAPEIELARVGASCAAIWSFAMLPLAVTALSVLMAQMEHGPRSWNHLLTLPGARPNAFLAKALVMLVLIAAMSALLWLEALGATWLLGQLKPQATGNAEPAALALTLAKMAVASMLVAMLQLWVALRFRSFVPPLVFGIAGTFVAIGATTARQGVYFPWLLAVNILSLPERQSIALWLGSLGGAAALLAMLVHLSRREA